MSQNKRWWHRFSSMKMGLFLLLAISIASAVGTVIPQKLPEGPVSLPMRILHLWDVYHSWWYIALLSLLALNLLACSFGRIKPMLVGTKRSHHLLGVGEITKLKYNTLFILPGKLDGAKVLVERLFTGQGYKVWSELDTEKIKMGAEQGRFYVLGSFITHISFLVILLGVFYGGVFGCKGVIDAAVGSTFDLTEVPGLERISREDSIQVRVDDFWIERYDNGSPSGYFSRLTILEKEQPVKTETLGVNAPLAYKGIKFYQSNWGQLAKIIVNRADGTLLQQGAANEGEILRVLGTDYSVLVYRYHFPSGGTMDETSIVYAIYKGDQPAGMGKAQFNQPVLLGDEGNTFAFTGLVPFTGLQVKKDPGVPMVIMGSLLMLLGIGSTVWLKPRKIWVVLEQQGETVIVTLGGVSHKNSKMFAEDFSCLVEELKATAKLTAFNHSIKEAQ
ncbi:MAG: cytochrome c biogenesis protein ResB [Syntrophomonadaceae bacterium]|nr:cytochrome c biogenesis protein ResB [Syntrophomonadaceae bacterium]MDD3889560.1 cytochrome c biogenesis protein ResB [Syntrophomonadaceae bacterium]